MKKNLCILMIIGCLSVPTLSIAEDTEAQSIWNNYVQQNTFPQLSADYINKLHQVYYMQNSDNDLVKTAQAADYLVKASEKYYGKEDRNTLVARKMRALNYWMLNMPKENLNELQEIYAIAVKKGYKDLEKSILENIANTYMIMEQPQNAINYYNKIKNSSETDKLSNLSRYYFQLKQNDKTIDTLDKYYASIQNPDIRQQYFYYRNVAETYLNEGKFDLVQDNKQKAADVIKNSDDEKGIDYSWLEFLRAEMYKKQDRYNEAKQVLDNLQNYLNSNNMVNQNENVHLKYLDLYKEMNDYANAEKEYNILKNMYSDFPKNSFRAILLEEKKIEILRDTNRIEEAIEHTNAILKQIESAKSIAPMYYAKFLKQNADNELRRNNTAEAHKYIDLFNSYYKKAQPEGSYAYKDVYEKYGELYAKENRPEESVKYYTKAINLINETQNYTDAPDIYINIARQYANIGNKEEAKANIDKAIALLIKIYGTNNSNTLEKQIDAYYMYNQMNMPEVAAAALQKINNTVEQNSIQGKEKEILFKLHGINAYKALSQNKYRQALKYAKIVQKNTTTPETVNCANRLFYDIYNQSRKTKKAQKYKELAHIQ